MSNQFLSTHAHDKTQYNKAGGSSCSRAIAAKEPRVRGPMSFRGRPSLSGTPGRSSLEPSQDALDLAKLRADLVSAKGLPCFQVCCRLQGDSRAGTHVQW